MTEKKATPEVDISLIKLDAAAVTAICNLIIRWIDTTPEEQHARNHKRADRIITIIEEKFFGLPPLE